MDSIETGRIRPEGSHNEAEQLRKLIDRKAEDGAIYRTLAGRSTSKRAKNIFTRLMRDEQRHLKMLQSSCFLLTGDSCRPDRPHIRNQGTLSLLRTMYRREENSAEDLNRSCQGTKIPNLKRIFKSIGEDDSRHSEILEDMIQNLMR